MFRLSHTHHHAREFPSEILGASDTRKYALQVRDNTGSIMKYDRHSVFGPCRDRGTGIVPVVFFKASFRRYGMHLSHHLLAGIPCFSKPCLSIFYNNCISLTDPNFRTRQNNRNQINIPFVFKMRNTALILNNS